MALSDAHATSPPGALWSGLARRRPFIAGLSAVVAVGLVAGSWALTTHLRTQAQAASAKVVAVTTATAQLSRLANQETDFFTGVAAFSFNFSRALAQVVVAVEAIHDPRAAPLLSDYVRASRRVVYLINQGDPLAAARAEVNTQTPASNALVLECNRYAAEESAAANSTLTRVGQLSATIGVVALLLLALILGVFWYLDARSDRERRREVEQTEARFRGIVARGSDAVWLVDPAGRVVFVSDATRAVLGADVDEAARPLFAEQFPVEERPALRRTLAEVFEDAEHPATVSVSLAEPDKRFLELVLTNRCADPSIGAVVVSIRDLTERRRAESALERSEALVQDLIDHTPVSIYVKDLAGRYQRVNKAWAQTMGRSPGEAVGATASELFSSANGAAIDAADREALDRGAYETELTLELEGRRRTFLTSRFPLLDAGGEPYAVGGVALDISDRVRQESLERTLGAMVSSVGDAIFTTSRGEIVFWNDAAVGLLGFARDDVIGATPAILTPEGYRADHARLWDAVNGGVTVHSVETVFRRRDDSLIHVEVTLTPQLGEDGAVTGVSAIVRDVTERRERHEELSRQARTDNLTGLPNRTALLVHLDRVLGRATHDGSVAALLFFDLDHFKEVNDSHPSHHAAGDELLCVTAARVSRVLRPADFVARLGGDEFVAVCHPVAGRDEAEEIARRVAVAVAEPVALGAETRTTSASVGVALTPTPDANTWLAQADAAMYQAKRAGRNQVVVFVEGMALTVPDRSAYRGRGEGAEVFSDKM